MAMENNVNNDTMIDEDAHDEKLDLEHIVTRAVALVIGLGLFVSDKIMHLIDPSLGMEVYGTIGLVALGYAPSLGGLFSKK